MNNEQNPIDLKDFKDFKQLLIDKEVQDDVIDTFKFAHARDAIECGMLVLSSFANAKKMGCDVLFFHRINNDKPEGQKHEYFLMDYIKLIEYVKNRPNEDSVHKVVITPYEESK